MAPASGRLRLVQVEEEALVKVVSSNEQPIDDCKRREKATTKGKFKKQ